MLKTLILWMMAGRGVDLVLLLPGMSVLGKPTGKKSHSDTNLQCDSPCVTPSYTIGCALEGSLVT